MKKVCFLFMLILFAGCKDEDKFPSREETQTAKLKDSLIFKPARIVHLRPEASAVIEDWLAYATASNQIETMKNSTVNDLIGYSQPLIQIMEALRNTLPDSLREPAIQSRVNVLVTKANILHQLSSKKDKESQEILETAEEVIIEFDNFKIQLNELFVKTPEEFELELDRILEQEQQDSILPTERQL